MGFSVSRPLGCTDSKHCLQEFAEVPINLGKRIQPLGSDIAESLTPATAYRCKSTSERHSHGAS